MSREKALDPEAPVLCGDEVLDGKLLELAEEGIFDPGAFAFRLLELLAEYGVLETNLLGLLAVDEAIDLGALEALEGRLVLDTATEPQTSAWAVEPCSTVVASLQTMDAHDDSVVPASTQRW